MIPINKIAIEILLSGNTLRTLSDEELAEMHKKLLEEGDTGFIMAIEIEIVNRVKGMKYNNGLTIRSWKYSTAEGNSKNFSSFIEIYFNESQEVSFTIKNVDEFNKIKKVITEGLKGDLINE